ncbi:MAG: ROK family protein [Bacilli bacterium]|nr:ROK family protein [Bacilli bacterium]
MANVLGIDIGGGMIKGGYFRDGTLLGQVKKPTKANTDFPVVYRQLCRVIEELSELYGGVDSIGIASPGDIDPKTMTFTKVINIKALEGINLPEKVTADYRVPCYLGNDAVAALIGELSLRPAVKSATMLTFGTGLGCATYEDGHFYQGSNRYNFGHMPLTKNGQLCRCGQKGCASTYVTASALRKLASIRLGRPLTCPEFLDLVHQGDRAALELLEDYCFMLNRLLTLVEDLTHPDLLLLGGGLMGAQDVFAPRIDLDPRLYEFATLGNQAGMTGAMILAMKKGEI